MDKLQSNTKKVVAGLIRTLSPRNRDILSRRFGLKNGSRETLESIGKSYKITRERVRQIEESSMKQLKEQFRKRSKEFGPYIRLATSLLEEHGGTLREDELFNNFSGNRKATAANLSLAFIMHLDSQFKKHKGDDQFHPYWTLSDNHTRQAKKTIAVLVKAFAKRNRPVEASDLHNFYSKHSGTTLYPKALFASISLSKNIGKNIFGQVGIKEWPDITPRGVRDKAYLVLKNYGKPAHFRNIAAMINRAGFDNKNAHTQTVHNELIKDNRFVLVGRGIYALAEWGYKTGTVKEVIKDILRESKEPLSASELVKKVLNSRIVKENTILLNLQDSKVFEKLNNGKYTLKTA